MQEHLKPRSEVLSGEHNALFMQGLLMHANEVAVGTEISLLCALLLNLSKLVPMPADAKTINITLNNRSHEIMYDERSLHKPTYLSRRRVWPSG